MSLVLPRRVGGARVLERLGEGQVGSLLIALLGLDLGRRDLYAAQAVYRGELPYKDFWWVYGPLMPYYYGLFFKIFGVHIGSMLLGKLILKILGGILICLGLMEVSSNIAAFFGACWFMLFQQLRNIFAFAY